MISATSTKISGKSDNGQGVIWLELEVVFVTLNRRSVPFATRYGQVPLFSGSIRVCFVTRLRRLSSLLIVISFTHGNVGRAHS